MTNDWFSISNGLGTQKFMALEILNEEEYNEKVGVYSFGVLLYFIISGGELPKIKIKDICMGKKALMPDSFTSFTKSLINECWNFDYNERPSFDSICDKLENSKEHLLNLTDVDGQEVNQFLKKYKSYLPAYSK
ncbi:hypothetical protein M9Y10_043441 [Tritrichomonas musculus]|uniref:Serine-threonine/tyrosine-protein kinase catalytic domain-containing protein n=1 Tax=Tritrichomonas musculus TaxID=1915356 RepID=A0ABR2JZS0_9EUKA